jgi:hypothetical protein
VGIELFKRDRQTNRVPHLGTANPVGVTATTLGRSLEHQNPASTLASGDCTLCGPPSATHFSADSFERQVAVPRSIVPNVIVEHTEEVLFVGRCCLQQAEDLFTLEIEREFEQPVSGLS